MIVQARWSWEKSGAFIPLLGACITNTTWTPGEKESVHSHLEDFHLSWKESHRFCIFISSEYEKLNRTSLYNAICNNFFCIFSCKIQSNWKDPQSFATFISEESKNFMLFNIFENLFKTELIFKSSHVKLKYISERSTLFRKFNEDYKHFLWNGNSQWKYHAPSSLWSFAPQNVSINYDHETLFNFVSLFKINLIKSQSSYWLSTPSLILCKYTE